MGEKEVIRGEMEGVGSYEIIIDKTHLKKVLKTLNVVFFLF